MTQPAVPIAFVDLMDRVRALMLATPAIVPAHDIGRQRLLILDEGVNKGLGIRLANAVPGAPMAGRGGPSQWQTSIGLDCLVRCTEQQSPDEAVAPLLAAVHARMVSGALATAGYSVGQPRLMWEQETTDGRIGVCTLIYPITHTTAAADLTTWS